MKFFNNFSIKFKITALCVSIVLFSMIIFTIVSFVHSGRVVNSLAEKNANQIMDSATNKSLSLINDINTMLLTFQTNETIQSGIYSADGKLNPEKIQILEKKLREMDLFQTKISKAELYILNSSEYDSEFNSKYILSDSLLKNDSWYNLMINSGTSIKWFVRDDVSVTNSYITASKLIYNVYAQKPVAILRLDIDMANFTSHHTDLMLADTGKIFLCTQNHIVNMPNPPSFVSALINHPAIFNDAISYDTPQTRIINLNGNEWLIKTNPLASTGMYLLGAVKINEFSSVHTTMGYAMIVTSLVLLIFSLLLTLFIAQIITKPLATLTNRMKNYDIDRINNIKSNSNDEIGVLFNSFNSMDGTIHRLIDDLAQEAKIRKIAELKALQAQITPHFLYNTLNSISALSKLYGVKKIEKMTLALSKFFLHSLNNGAEMITIENELEQTMSYVYLQKIRFEDKFDVNIIADSDVKKYLICKLTLQPLVENCIYHAFNGIRYPGLITIRVSHENDDIVITVSDNGVGNMSVNFKEINEYVNSSFDPNEPVEKYGIHNVSQRIKLYFGEKYGLCYYPNPDSGLTVKITFKAIRQNENNERN